MVELTVHFWHSHYIQVGWVSRLGPQDHFRHTRVGQPPPVWPEQEGSCSFRVGVPNLQGLMPDDLRNWCNNNRNKVQCSSIILKPPPPPPPTLVHGKTVFHETSSWCQKGWKPLPYGKSGLQAETTDEWVVGSKTSQTTSNWRQTHFVFAEFSDLPSPWRHAFLMPCSWQLGWGLWKPSGDLLVSA